MMIRAFIISKSSIVGYWYNRRLRCLYFPHFNLNNKFHKVKGKSGHKTRVVSKVYKYDGKINFVAHRGLKFNVTRIDNTFYIVFNFFRLFTRDGKQVIEGDEAKQLHYKFPPTKAFNNIERSKLDFLITLIDLKHIDWGHPSYINTSKPIKIEVPCKSIKGYIFDDIEPEEEYINPFEEWEDEF